MKTIYEKEHLPNVKVGKCELTKSCKQYSVWFCLFRALSGHKYNRDAQAKMAGACMVTIDEQREGNIMPPSHSLR